MTDFRFARVYDEPGSDDGARVLADRLWPRGITKADADLTLWIKAIAPSDELRRWLHGGGDYAEFERRYLSELDRNDEFPDTADAVLEYPVVTLLTATKDPARTHLPVLARALQARAAKATG
ncbi:DUF488 domain-containing protein [Cumulibacter manganitolerans]|uniref:DUF488 domain-containing protein n=1 Tax=Cumulibacter manganitolerans TaxID=1884992 RepID=UPI001294EE01|nr:DUF488 family protein [Cumulibacter manganitolerans]